MTQQEIDNERDIERLRRKLNQAWELAGLARRDGDSADEARHKAEARAIQRRMTELTG